MNKRTECDTITPLAGRKLIITIMGESIQISTKRKLKKEVGIIPPTIENISREQKSKLEK